MKNQNIKQLEADNLAKILSDNFGYVLVFVFYAEWNQQSKQLLLNFNNTIPIFGQYHNARYYSLSAEKNLQAFKLFQVEKTPTVIFTQTDKKILYRYEADETGPIYDQLAITIQQYTNQFEKDKAIWHPKIKNMLQSNKLVIFIKGTPQNTKCDLSTRIINALSNNNIQYTYYNILQDQHLRQWVKHYTGCKQYPSVFVNTKSIGQTDHIKQILQTKQFINIIPQECRQRTIQEQYNKIINQNETIIFVDAYPFENKNTERAVNDAHNIYGDNIYIYNIAIHKQIKNYITEKINKNLPFTVHNKQIIQNS